MSGGKFDYAQYRIADIYNDIEDYLNGHKLDDEEIGYYINDRWLEDEDKDYIRRHLHTIPNRYGYTEETLAEFRKGIEMLKQAEVYAQRIDWLLSGDDGEETFHNRLKEDLNKLKNESTIKMIQLWKE